MNAERRETRRDFTESSTDRATDADRERRERRVARIEHVTETYPWLDELPASTRRPKVLPCMLRVDSIVRLLSLLVPRRILGDELAEVGKVLQQHFTAG